MKAPKGKYAWSVKIGEKGQFVIPKEAREIFDIKPGDTILLLGDDKKGMAIPPKRVFAKVMEQMFFSDVPEDMSEEEPEENSEE